jgi:hypothetical protein
MVQGFPKDHELIGFFEAEPAILDPAVPWVYNTLDFTTNRNGIEVRARISPSYRELTLRLLLDGHELVLFELKEAEEFRVDTDKEREALVVTFAEQRRLEDFVLQLKPSICVSWGNRQFS